MPIGTTLLNKSQLFAEQLLHLIGPCLGILTAAGDSVDGGGIYMASLVLLLYSMLRQSMYLFQVNNFESTSGGGWE